MLKDTSLVISSTEIIQIFDNSTDTVPLHNAMKTGTEALYDRGYLEGPASDQ